MIRSTILKTVAPAVLGLAALMGGCAAGGDTGAAPSKQHAAHAGLMCPKCETVWMMDATTGGGRGVTMLQSRPEMNCPDCDRMAKSHLMGDGKAMLHDCPTCKTKLIPISAPPTSTRGPRGGTHD